MLEVTFEPGVQVVSFVGGGKGNHATSVRCGFRSGPRCLYHQHQWPAVSVLTLCVLRLLGGGRHRGGDLQEQFGHARTGGAMQRDLGYLAVGRRAMIHCQDEEQVACIVSR